MTNRDIDRCPTCRSDEKDMPYVGHVDSTGVWRQCDECGDVLCPDLWHKQATDRDYEIELSTLQAELATVKAERDDLNKRLAWAEEMRDVWRRKDQDGAWHWAGDGSDFPETLVCPVLMSAATLRELLAERDDLRDAIRLMIGMDTNTPWPDVPQSDVDGWMERIRQLKKGGA